jgi:hypothetical protein
VPPPPLRAVVAEMIKTAQKISRCAGLRCSTDPQFQNRVTILPLVFFKTVKRGSGAALYGFEEY